jgi:hypothetical protein
MNIDTHFGPGCGCTACNAALRPTPTFDCPARIDGRVRHHPLAEHIADCARELRAMDATLLDGPALVLALRALGLDVEAATLQTVGHLLENCPVPYVRSSKHLPDGYHYFRR